MRPGYRGHRSVTSGRPSSVEGDDHVRVRPSGPWTSPSPRQRRRPDGDDRRPGPLGLAAFAMTTFVLSVFNTNIVKDAKLEAVVLPLALFYGGIGSCWPACGSSARATPSARSRSPRSARSGSRSPAYVKFVVPGSGRPARGSQGDRPVPAGVGDLHRLHDGRRVRTSGAVLAVFVSLTLTFIFLTHRRASAPSTRP